MSATAQPSLLSTANRCTRKVSPPFCRPSSAVRALPASVRFRPVIAARRACGVGAASRALRNTMIASVRCSAVSSVSASCNRARQARRRSRSEPSVAARAIIASDRSVGKRARASTAASRTAASSEPACRAITRRELSSARVLNALIRPTSRSPFAPSSAFSNARVADGDELITRARLAASPTSASVSAAASASTASSRPMCPSKRASNRRAAAPRL